MYDAQTIQMQGDTSTVVLSPWFPRGGDYGLFTLEAIKLSSSSANLQIQIEMVHKNAADTGDGGSAIANSAFAVAGDATTLRVTKDMSTAVSGFTGFKELVRYKITLLFSGGSGTNWAIFRMLPPVWYDKV